MGYVARLGFSLGRKDVGQSGLPSKALVVVVVDDDDDDANLSYRSVPKNAL